MDEEVDDRTSNGFSQRSIDSISRVVEKYALPSDRPSLPKRKPEADLSSTVTPSRAQAVKKVNVSVVEDEDTVRAFRSWLYFI